MDHAMHEERLRADSNGFIVERRLKETGIAAGYSGSFHSYRYLAGDISLEPHG